MRSQTSSVSPYQIKAAPLPDRYPRGWFCLGLLDSFRPPNDTVQKLEALGGQLKVTARGSVFQVEQEGRFLPTLERCF